MVCIPDVPSLKCISSSAEVSLIETEFTLQQSSQMHCIHFLTFTCSSNDLYILL